MQPTFAIKIGKPQKNSGLMQLLMLQILHDLFQTLAMEYGWRKEKTVENLKKALNYQKNALKLQKSNITIDSKILGNISALHLKLGDFEAAQRVYTEALSISPEDQELRYKYSTLLLRKGMFEHAEKEIAGVINSGFQHPDCWNLLSSIELMVR